MGVTGEPACKMLTPDEAQDSIQRVDSELALLMGTYDAAAAERVAKEAKAVAEKRPANYDVAMAMERAVQVGLNVSFKQFQYSRCPAALTATQTRRFKSFEWPEPRGDAMRRRAFIEDSSNGNRFWEVPVRTVGDEYVRMAVHTAVDQCSKGWHSCVWLYTGLPKVRGTFTLDRLHTCLNVFADARAAAGLGLLHLEWLTALASSKGPKVGQGHKRTLWAYGEHLFRALHADHFMFMLVYEELARDLGEAAGPNLWSDEHKRHVLKRAEETFRAKFGGAFARRDRWFRFEEAYRQQRPLVTILMLVMLFWGQRNKLWNSLETSPMRSFVDLPETADDGDGIAAGPAADDAAGGDVGDHTGDAGGPGGDADGGGADDGDDGAGLPGHAPLTRAGARKKLKQMKGQYPRQLQFACHVFSNIRGKRLMDCVMHIQMPFEERFRREMTLLHSVNGVETLFLGLVRNDYASVYRVMLDRFFSPELGALLCLERDPLPEVLEKTGAAVQKLWLFTCGCIGELELLNLMYTETPPFFFMNSLDPEEGSVPVLMRKVRRWWELLQRLEKEALQDCKLQNFVRGLIWPAMGMARELFIGAEETKWSEMPAPLLQDLRAWSQTVMSTLLNENLNKAVKKAERQSNSQRLGPLACWNRVITSSEWDEFGRPLVGRTRCARAAAMQAAPLTGSAFKPAAAEEPFTREQMDDLTATAPSFSNAAPDKFRLHPLAWQLAVTADGCADTISCEAFNLLVDVGIILDDCVAKRAGVVMLVTKFGLILQPVYPCKEDVFDCTLLSLTSESRHYGKLRYVHLDQPLQRYRVLQTRIIMPGESPVKGHAGLSLRLSAARATLTICEYASRTGFHRCLVPHLLFLRRQFRITTKPRPPSKEGLIAELVKHFEPGLTDDQVTERVELGGQIAEAGAADVLQADELNAFINGEDDAEEYSKEAEELAGAMQKLERRRAEVRRAHRQAEPEHLPVAAPAAPEPIVVRDREDGWTQPRAKRLLPRGAQISLHRAGGTRWTMRYPGFHISPDRSKNYGGRDGFTQWEALVYLLRLVWDVHTELTEERCPYVFECGMF